MTNSEDSNATECTKSHRLTTLSCQFRTPRLSVLTMAETICPACVQYTGFSTVQSPLTIYYASYRRQHYALFPVRPCPSVIILSVTSHAIDENINCLRMILIFLFLVII